MYISNTFSLRMLANIPATFSVIEVIPRKYEKTTTWAEWMAEYIDYARSNGIESVESHIWDAKIANILGLPHNPERITLNNGDCILVALLMNSSEPYWFRFLKIAIGGKAPRLHRPRRKNPRKKSTK